MTRAEADTITNSGRHDLHADQTSARLALPWLNASAWLAKQCVSHCAAELTSPRLPPVTACLASRDALACVALSHAPWHHTWGLTHTCRHIHSHPGRTRRGNLMSSWSPLEASSVETEAERSALATEEAEECGLRSTGMSRMMTHSHAHTNKDNEQGICKRTAAGAAQTQTRHSTLHAQNPQEGQHQ